MSLDEDETNETEVDGGEMVRNNGKLIQNRRHFEDGQGQTVKDHFALRLLLSFDFYANLTKILC